MKAGLRIAGHTFTLKNTRYGIHSDETIDYISHLYCDGKRIAEVGNEGQGGATYSYYDKDNYRFAREVEDAIGNEVWLLCQDGTIIMYDLGTIADELLILEDTNIN